jgi:hypothetical protein
MNCRIAQEKITGSLAASSALTPEAAVHRDSCAKCRAFYESERGLFEFLNNGLRNLVNQPMPPSLLPQVRAHLDLVPATPYFGTLQQRLAGVAALLILALSMGYLEHGPQIKTDTQYRQAAMLSGLNNLAPALSVSEEPISARSKRTRKQVISRRPPQAEVIVSSEERRALARFVARVPEQNKAVVDLTHSVPLDDEPPPEMAAVDLGKVEIQPLEAEARE